MNPLPVLFEPNYKARPWGGDKLAALFGRPLPPGQPIGELWGLSSLPGDETRVARGPLAGKTLRELRTLWGDTLGPADDTGGFPLLIKFLDARENLSVQVHPSPVAGEPDSASGVKHEGWYVVDAAPHARLLLGLTPGVGREAVRDAAGSARIVEHLQSRPARAGDWFYLPSGTPHALGAGLVVVEVQTTSDVTYRLFDWDRVGPDGHPRPLHISQALANLRDDVPESEIRPIARPLTAPAGVRRCLLDCPAFTLAHATCDPARWSEAAPAATVWIMLRGRGALGTRRDPLPFAPGDVLLLPGGGPYPVQIERSAEWLIAQPYPRPAKSA